MNLNQYIENCEERIPEKVISLKNERLPLYLCGNSKMALRVIQSLKTYNVEIGKVLVGKEYYKENEKFEGIDVEAFESYEQTKNKFNVFIGFDVYKFKEYFWKIMNCDIIYHVYMFCPEYLNLSKGLRKLIYTNKKIQVIDNYYPGLVKRNLDYKYFKENINEFQETFDMLEDQLSKETFLAYLKGHINVSNFPMKKVFVDNQYFCRDIIKLCDDEVFVDCGGYIGDTVEEFILNSAGKYKKIYVFEPDPKVYQKLIDNVKGLDDIVTINKGTLDKCDKVNFYNDESGSSSVGNIFDFDNEIEIEVDKIDNIIRDRVTMIKMDVEGAELKSLYGAEKTIIDCKPKMAICVYHKKEDLITIPQYLKKIVPEYKFYLRGHMEIASEVVLYAVK